MKLSRNLTLSAKGEHGHVLVMQGEIGFYPLVTPEIKYKLDQVPDNEPLEVRISSTGGDPVTGVQVYNMLKQHKGTVTTIVEDFAMSAATLPMAAGDGRLIDRLVGEVMIHNARSENCGVGLSEEDHRTIADIIARTNDQMRAIYVEEFGVSESVVSQWMNETKTFNAEEAVSAGICTQVDDVNRVTDQTEDDVRLAAHYKEKMKSNGRTKSPAKTEKSNNDEEKSMSFLQSMKAKLGLGDDSDEADALYTVTELKAQKDTLKAEKQTLESDLDEVKKERDQFKKELDELKKDSEESEEEELETTLSAMVDGFQIKASQKDELAEKYKGNLEGLKELKALLPEGAHKPGGAGAKVTASGKRAVRGGAPERTSKHFNQ